ncbi:MAG: 2Fe-2S iron-sulfur cluster binding domain-containing protein [Polynucleobacter sp.]|nr:2Fe-2S iron-sulfur cluster binding domain-containing protein [Polynucleobacter sp.]
MKVELIGAGETVQVYESKSSNRLLYSGLKEGADVPYECATGTCGTCKVKRISGEFSWLWPEAPARALLKSADDFLLCQCAAVTDLKVEVRSKLKPIKEIAQRPQWLTSEINNSATVAPGVMTFSVKLSQPISFLPGQFMVLEFAGVQGGRAWSMTNQAKLTDTLDFVIKKKPHGLLSDYLFEKENLIGLKANLFGPIGKAVYDGELDRDLVCIAGGTGMAGMMSILAAFIDGGAYRRNRADVFFGVRTPADLFFESELRQFVEQSDGALRVVVAFSDAPASAELIAKNPLLTFDQGFVHEVAMSEMEGQFTPKTRAYLAGPPPLVDGALRMLLLKARLPATEILYDKFG